MACLLVSWLNNFAGFLFIFTLDCCSLLIVVAPVIVVVALVVAAVVVASAADKWKQRKNTHKFAQAECTFCTLSQQLNATKLMFSWSTPLFLCLFLLPF